MQDTMGATSGGDVPVAPKTNPWKIVAFLALGGFILMAGCIGLLIKGGTAAYKESGVDADRFLTAMEKHDYKTAHQRLVPEAQKKASEADMGDIVALLEKRRGKMTRHTGPQGFNARSNNGVSIMRLTYSEAFAGGEKTNVDVTMTNANGTWQVYSFNYSL